MKKILFIITCILFSFSFVKAQDDEGKRADKIQALKIAFITEKLSLTSDEAQRFWPLYSQYESEMKSLNRDKNNDGDVLDNEEKQLNIRKKYRSQFIQVLGQPRMNTLFNAEREFRGILLQRLRNNNQQRLLKNR